MTYRCRGRGRGPRPVSEGMNLALADQAITPITRLRRSRDQVDSAIKIKQMKVGLPAPKAVWPVLMGPVLMGLVLMGLVLWGLVMCGPVKAPMAATDSF